MDDDPRTIRRTHLAVLPSIFLILNILLAGCLPVSGGSSPQPATAIPSSATANQTGPVSTKPPVPTNIVAPSLTSTQPPAFPLAGAWSGTARNGSFEMQISITIDAACQVGLRCGTFTNPTLPCSGTFTLLGEKGGIYEFQAGDKQGSCGVGQDFLQRLTGASLQYTSRGAFGETSGVLALNISAGPTQQAQRLPVIFDDDGSPDGTAALLYLLAEPEVALQAAVISHGESHPQVYIQHIGRLLDGFGFASIPLGAGQDGPLDASSNKFPEGLQQAADNFWGLPKPQPDKPVLVQDAAHLIVYTLTHAPQPVAVFVSGPCTDLAQALRLDPSIHTKISAVYIMGGAVYAHGNLSDLLPNPANTTAEWNIYADPQAAREVFTSGLKVYLVPLDATNQVLITKQDTTQWRGGGQAANFAADIFDMLLAGSSGGKSAIWDLMTAVLMVRPELCNFQPLHLDVITAAGSHSGQTVVDPQGTEIHVCLAPQADAIRQALAGVLSSSQ